MENRDVFRIYLNGEDADLQTATLGNFTFNVKLPARRVQYTKYILYVDDFNICLKGLTDSNILLKCNVGQYNSFNSTTKGNNQVIATIFNPQTASGRTDDLSLNYQAPNTPNIITTLPNELVLNITNIDNTAVNMSDSENFFCVNLRIEAFYD
jgi:hypothetical protein